MLAADYPLLNLFWTMLLMFFFVIWIWVLITVLIDVFRSHDLSGVAKALWLIFIVFLPLLGVVVYLIARGNKMHEHAVKDAQAHEAAFKQYVQQAAAFRRREHCRRAHEARGPARQEASSRPSSSRRRRPSCSPDSRATTLRVRRSTEFEACRFLRVGSATTFGRCITPHLVAGAGSRSPIQRCRRGNSCGNCLLPLAPLLAVALAARSPARAETENQQDVRREDTNTSSSTTRARPTPRAPRSRDAAARSSARTRTSVSQPCGRRTRTSSPISAHKPASTASRTTRRSAASRTARRSPNVERDEVEKAGRTRDATASAAPAPRPDRPEGRAARRSAVGHAADQRDRRRFVPGRTG